MSYIQIKDISGDWGLGIGDWGLGPNPQSPIPNPQSPIPIPNPQSPFIKLYIFLYNILSTGGRS